jgi:DNA-binding MarR family transcriptional regulator
MNKKQKVSLPNGLLKELGVDRHSKSRALAALEATGLVSVERLPGRSPVVTIHDIEEPNVTV